MITNINNFSAEVLNSDKPTMVFFYRPTGCGNCEKMKPAIEQFEKENPQINVCHYECGKTPDAITSKYSFKMFPGIFTFSKGQVIKGMSGMKSLDELRFSFTSLTELKANIYDGEEALKKLTGNLDFFRNQVETFNQGTNVLEVIPQSCEEQCASECGDDKDCLSECETRCKHDRSVMNEKAKEELKEHLSHTTRNEDCDECKV